MHLHNAIFQQQRCTRLALHHISPPAGRGKWGMSMRDMGYRGFGGTVGGQLQIDDWMRDDMEMTQYSFKFGN